MAANDAVRVLDYIARMSDRVDGLERIANAREAGRAEGRADTAKIAGTIDRLAKSMDFANARQLADFAGEQREARALDRPRRKQTPRNAVIRSTFLEPRNIFGPRADEYRGVCRRCRGASQTSLPQRGRNARAGERPQTARAVCGAQIGRCPTSGCCGRFRKPPIWVIHSRQAR
jgi:hypothetical protein